jgi:AcrR family transcriptional regulator
MEARADAVEQTRESILRAAYDLWLEYDWDAVSLESVAARAGVSKQTVIRQFGSKDKLAFAIVDWQRPLEEAGRVVEPGDVKGAIEALIGRYEQMGDANVRVLHLEQRVPAIRYLLEQGRESHRAWIERVFRPFLPPRKGVAHRRQVMAFYAATEVTIWKLLRRDFQLSRADTEAIFLALVSGLVAQVREEE